MSDVISWIAAESEQGKAPEPVPFAEPELEHENQNEGFADEDQGFGNEEIATENENQWLRTEEIDLDRDADLRTYRGRTIAMLRLYLRYSLEAGRLPSLMGSEYFRTRVTCYTVVTFEDRVVFVHDMEVCLKKLCEVSQQVILRHVFQGHNQWDTARLLGCSEKTIRKYILAAIDELSDILLDVGLLEQRKLDRKKSCQGGKSDQFSASDCEDGK